MEVELCAVCGIPKADHVVSLCERFVEPICANCGLPKSRHCVTLGLNPGHAVVNLGPCIDGPKEWNKDEMEVATLCKGYKSRY